MSALNVFTKQVSLPPTHLVPYRVWKVWRSSHVIDQTRTKPYLNVWAGKMTRNTSRNNILRKKKTDLPAGQRTCCISGRWSGKSGLTMLHWWYRPGKRKHKSTWVLKKGECPKAEQSQQVNSASLCPLPFTVGNTALGAGLARIKATALLQISAEVSGELMVVFHFTTSRAIPALRLQPIVSCPSPTPWIQNLLLYGDAGPSQCSGSTKTFRGNSKGLRDYSSTTQVLSCTQTLQQPWHLSAQHLWYLSDWFRGDVKQASEGEVVLSYSWNKQCMSRISPGFPLSCPSTCLVQSTYGNTYQKIQ